MSEVPKIVDFASIVDPHLAGGKLISYTSRYLTKPGENYGSIMLAIVAHVKRVNGEIEELPLVAKLPPITNEFYWEIFQPERTCLSENATYKYVALALRVLQQEAGVEENQLFDGFPHYYGSRISLDPAATKVDRDAVLVQENLQTSGYKAGNRHKMFDLATTKLLLQEIAKYHALPIAWRLKKPDEFDQFARPYFRKFNMNSNMAPDVKDQLYGESFKDIQMATNNNDKVVESLKKLFASYDAFLENPEPKDTKFTTIVHSDMWINNLMLQYDENGMPSKVKFVDFQIAQYESMVHDIIFFLFTSVDTAVLEEHYEAFFKLYFKSFVACMESLNIPTEEYTYKSFMDEVKRVGPIELPHALFMVKIILADNSTMPEDFKDMDITVLSKNTGAVEITQKTKDIIRLAQKFKFC